MLFYLLKFVYRVIIINLNWNKNIKKKIIAWNNQNIFLLQLVAKATFLSKCQ